MKPASQVRKSTAMANPAAANMTSVAASRPASISNERRIRPGLIDMFVVSKGKSPLSSSGEIGPRRTGLRSAWK